MALESGTYINSLNANNPASTDGLGQADDHFRLIKSTILSTFPSVDAAVTTTEDELNVLDGSATTPAAVTLVDADGVVVNDGGVMKQTTVAAFKTAMSIPQTLLDLGISDGAANTFLKTDGSGNFSFATPPVVTGMSYNTGNGVLTATRGGGLSNVTATIPTHPSINAASSVNNSGSTFIQDITVDGNGHITGVGSATVPTNAGLVRMGTSYTYPPGDYVAWNPNYNQYYWKVNLNGSQVGTQTNQMFMYFTTTTSGYFSTYSFNTSTHAIAIFTAA